MNNRNFVIVTAVLLLLCGLIFVPRFVSGEKRQEEAQMARLPMTIGSWQGKDIEILERDYEILETRNLIMREYSNAQGQHVTLYIIYSGDNRKALHPPEICYTGGGTTILNKSVVTLTPALKANCFVIEYKNGREVVAYWFRCGTYNTPRFVEQQLKTMIGRTLGKQTSGAMIRISSPEKEGDGNHALELIKEFTALIEPLLNTYVL